MPEQFSPRSLFDKIKRALPEGDEQRAERVAREAFLLVHGAGPQGQEPQATYERDFNLLDHRAGTVFRFMAQNQRGEAKHYWYAIGQSEKQGVKIYTAINPLQHGTHLDYSNPYLVLEPDWYPARQTVTLPYFQVVDTQKNIRYPGPHVDYERMEKMLDAINRAYIPDYDQARHHPLKIDIITAGSKERVRQKRRANLFAGSLQPKPQQGRL
jgi:hypothetical protein